MGFLNFESFLVFQWTANYGKKKTILEICQGSEYNLR